MRLVGDAVDRLYQTAYRRELTLQNGHPLADSLQLLRASLGLVQHRCEVAIDLLDTRFDQRHPVERLTEIGNALPNRPQLLIDICGRSGRYLR